MPLFRDEVLEWRRGSEWQAPLLSRPPSAHLVAVFSFVVIAASLGFATTYEFARKEQVHGYLSPVDGWSRVTARSSGIVTRRYANAGERVEFGEVLFEISSGRGFSESLTVEGRMLQELEEQRSTLSIRADLVSRQYEQEKALVIQQNNADRAELSLLDQEIQLSETRLEVGRQRQLELKGLATSGYLTRTDVIRMEEEVRTWLLALWERRREADRLRARVTASELRLKQLDISRDLDLAAIREQSHALAIQGSQIRSEETMFVMAPRTGTVASMRVEVGDPVQHGQQLLDIVPANTELEGRLLVPSEGMGFIEPGQDVRVYLDAFPYERYGVQSGRVRSISETTLVPGEAFMISVQDNANYQVNVTFPDGFNLPNDLIDSVRPGMTLTADIVRDYGTLLDWMLEPLNRTARRL